MPSYDDDFLSVPVKRGGGPVHVMKLASDASAVRDPREIASLILSKSGWKEMRDQLRLRFIDIMVSHVKDVRDPAETRSQLTRPADKNGLGMSPVEADAAMAAAKEVLALKPRQPIQIPSQKPGAPTVVKEVVTAKNVPPADEKDTIKAAVAMLKAEKSAPKVVSPTKLTPTLSSEERGSTPTGRPQGVPLPSSVVPSVRPTKVAAPIRPSEPVKPVMPPPPAPKPPVAVAPLAPKPVEPTPAPVARPETKLPASRDEAIAMLTNEVMSELAMRFADSYLEDRLRSAISGRLRDIRDWMETVETLGKKVNAGGIGLTPDEIARVKASLEPRVARIQTELYAQQKKKVIEALEKERDADLTRATTSRAEDKAETDALFEQITGKSPSSSPVVEAGARKPASLPARSPIAPPGKTPNAPKIMEAPAVRPLSPSVPAPTMTDVRPPMKLVGPVDELRRLTLVDFRKLSSDPTEAVRKIKDKLRLLEDESLPLRLQGIAALKESELFSVYWSIAQASIAKGVPVDTSLEERQRNDLPVLTKAEFDAIMDLNRALRF